MKATRRPLSPVRLLSLLAGAWLAVYPTACVQLEPRAVTTTTYLLAMPRRGDGGSAGGVWQPAEAVVGLQLLGLPGYAERFGLAVRNDRNEVHYAPAHRWAEPLRTAVSRFLRMAMEQRAPTLQVLPWPDRSAFAGAAPAVIFAVEIEQLDAFEDGSVRLQARAHKLAGEIVAVRVWQYQSTWQPADYASLVSAHAANLEQLAADLLAWLAE